MSKPPGGTGGQTLVFKKLKFLLTPSILDFVLSGFPALSNFCADAGLGWFFAQSLPGNSRDMFTRSSTRVPDLNNIHVNMFCYFFLQNYRSLKMLPLLRYNSVRFMFALKYNVNAFPPFTRNRL